MPVATKLVVVSWTHAARCDESDDGVAMNDEVRDVDVDDGNPGLDELDGSVAAVSWGVVHLCSVYEHSLPAPVHREHKGRASSHLTFRCLHSLHPRRDFRWRLRVPVLDQGGDGLIRLVFCFWFFLDALIYYVQFSTSWSW